MTTTIEEVKKFWDDRPCNVRHSDKEIGTLEYFKEVTDRAPLYSLKCFRPSLYLILIS